jgi:hypothetical protein
MSKTKVKLTGTDGNVFALIGKCSAALKKDGKYAEAKEMVTRCFCTGSYDEALRIMMEYCEVR